MAKRRLLAFGFAFACASVALLAQEGFPLVATDFSPEEFAARRGSIYDAIGKDGVAVLQGAPSPPGYTRFRQSNDFYYLSGVEVPNASSPRRRAPTSSRTSCRATWPRSRRS